MAERGWSQADLAHAMETSVKTIANRLNGYRRWTLDEVDRLALLGAELPLISEGMRL